MELLPSTKFKVSSLESPPPPVNARVEVPKAVELEGSKWKPTDPRPRPVRTKAVALQSFGPNIEPTVMNPVKAEVEGLGNIWVAMPLRASV